MYSDDTLNAVKNFGLLEYPIDQIVLLISELTTDVIDRDTFISTFNDTNSDIRIAYEKGKALAMYQIDKRLLEMAKSGDLKALEKYEERQFIRSKQKKKK